MDKQTRDLANTAYRGGVADPARLTPGERVSLREAGVVLNDMVTITHDDLVHRARVAVGSVSLAQAVDAFVAGLGGSWRRGLPVLDAYSWCARLPEHRFQPFTGPANPVHVNHHPTRSPVCAVCAVRPDCAEDRTYLRLIFWRGLPWGGLLAAVFNLEELGTLPPVQPTGPDIDVLRAVLDLFAHAAAGTAAGAAEDLLTRARVVPKSNARLRRAALDGLAAAGVLPQDLLPCRLDGWYDAETEFRAWRSLGRSHRYDIMLPLAGWRGEHGVDRARVDQLFGRLLTAADRPAPPEPTTPRRLR